MTTYTFEVETLRIIDGKKKRHRKQVNVAVPTDPEEITLRAWVDYSALRLMAPKWFNEIKIGSESSLVVPKGGWNDFVVHAIKSIVCLAINRDELSENDLLSLPFGEYEQSPDSLLAIISTMLKPIHEYQAKKRETFTHKGQLYAMYTNYVDAFGQKWTGKEMRTAEAVDALQFEQVFFQKDEDGNLYEEDAVYKNLLALTCMLSRKVLQPHGALEQPPVGLSERTTWMDERMAELSDMDMTIGLDIDFFLPSSKTALLRTLKSALRGKMEVLQQRQRKEKQSV